MAEVFPNSSSSNWISGLARSLLQAGRLCAAQIEALHKKSSRDQTPFIAAVLASGYLDTGDLALFCAENFGYPQLDLNTLKLSSLWKKESDAKLTESHTVLALAKCANKIYVAFSDPTNMQVLNQIKFPTELMIVEYPALLKQIQKLVKSAEKSLNEMVDDEQEINFVEEDADATANDIDDAPVVRFLKKILTDAINQGASDLAW